MSDSEDRWEFRTKREEFLQRFGGPDKAEQDQVREALDELTDALLKEARYHASWSVATAEKWRYDRLMWTFAVMLGEVPEDTPAPEKE